MQSVKEMLTTWNQTRGEREKLQHAYIVIVLAGFVIAGLVGLLNDDLSALLVKVCLVALGVFIANVVVWALLFSLVIVRLPKRTNGNSTRK